ncbi:MAG TPA: pilus assembly protein PilM [Sumerlaeia bacterium]|nr:pilus assembly protein PilM [Sumerlaeia bacterium]
MAVAKRCLGVDLGTHAVRIAEMAIDRGGVRAVRLVSEVLPIGPTATPAERSAALVAAVRGLIKTHKIATRKAVFSIPGQTVFVRPSVHVPKAPDPRLHQIIQFEARQLIPFPLDKTIMEYQVFETAGEQDVEVLLVAMKKETNQEFMRTIRRMGLRAIALNVSSLALFNGQEIHRFNLQEWQESSRKAGAILGIPLGLGGKAKTKQSPKLRKKKAGKGADDGKDVPKIADEAAAAVSDESGVAAEMRDLVGEDFAVGGATAFEEVRAYVNLGARSTDLAIAKAERGRCVGFTRSVPLGGAHITNAILKECGCETFLQAERVKLERTAVLSGGFEFEADKSRYDERACRVATLVCDRIIAELRRSLDYFISQPDGAAVDSLVLSGGGAHLAYLPGYIEERLGMQVATPQELGNDQIKCPSQYTDGFDFSPYRIAIGLATQGLGISPIRVNFLPAEIRGMQNLGSQYGEMALLAGMIGGMIFFSAEIATSSVSRYRRQIDEYQSLVTQAKPIQERKSKADVERKAIVEKLDPLARQILPRDYWLEFLSLIQMVKPPEVLITEVRCQPEYWDPTRTVVWIKAESEQQGAITQFVRGLKETKDRVIDAKLVSSAEPNEQSPFWVGKTVARFSVGFDVQRGDKKPLTRLAPPTPEPTPEEAAPGVMGVGGMPWGGYYGGGPPVPGGRRGYYPGGPQGY